MGALRAVIAVLIVGVVIFGYFFSMRVSDEIAQSNLGPPAGKSVLFVGHAFIGRSTPFNHVRSAVLSAAPEQAYQLAQPIDVSILEQFPHDLKRARDAIKASKPSAIVIMARSEVADQPGWSSVFTSNVAEIAMAAKAVDAEVFLVAHPPSASDIGLGFKGKALQIHNIATDLADTLGAILVPLGVAMTAIPKDQVALLYSSNKKSLSRTGDYIAAMAILAALGDFDVNTIEPPARLALNAAELKIVQDDLRRLRGLPQD